MNWLMPPSSSANRDSAASSTLKIAYVVLAASSSFAVFAWQLVQWTARRRATDLADQVKNMVKDGVMVDCSSPKVRASIISRSTQRASKWMTFQSLHRATPLPTQVGGMSFSGRRDPILALSPDYALKPCQGGGRGLREIAFYEAVKLADRNLDNDDPRSILALWLDIFKRHEGEETWEVPLLDIVSWRRLKREIELLRRLSVFIPRYYGVIAQPTLKNQEPVALPPFLSNSSHLLLQDVTANFSKPCVLDLKMGQRSYEPDAPLDKIDKEIGKYAQQVLFGFRIIGMRVYDSHAGFHTYNKTFGRSLKSEEQVMTALKGFFQRREGEKEKGNNRQVSSNILRKRVIRSLIYLLKSIKIWFEENTMLGFYASSLLIVYEGDSTSRSDVVDVKMIDFGHVRRQRSGDSGYLYGLKMLIGMLNTILDDEKGGSEGNNS
mmetsp:Transcript_44610/g.53999  ORF Transcript_44610/g.53999 Transcript_44610/m.53999 type:complete len:436 (-) Transcript_44610:24-1331(-)|eukprot:CAMPEP_0172496198 /NCGR_PEP_ID=MMETSP1066-20121228/83237_1 /TAXON_ID=671091 /ORGANISM="Coscinodiscus wailesii, Strain CCMP2513" /LENGTH=435 /DNA_ID=CAMNT_0013268375 /DNA_START=80 /DNA_END=1383 /DNA_ORIENTATION=-